MRSFASPSFFHIFDMMVGLSNPGLKQPRWTFNGVELERERHSFAGPKHGLTIEIFTLSRPGKQGWTFMVVKEYWWAGRETKAMKMTRWAKPLSGQRADMLAWLKTQEAHT